jgi:glycosyltransferase involved in cell wall biosynthesis
MPYKNIRLSVIIPALNEEKYIPYTINGLKNQSFKGFETIVVDGNSKDKTRDIAKRGATVIIQKKKGMSIARNSGAKISKGEVLLFLDADTEPSKDLLALYNNAFKDPNVVAATGPLAPLEKTTRIIRLFYALDSVYLKKLSFFFRRPKISACNFAVRKTVFYKVHGFKNEYATYEGYDLSDRLKNYGKFIYINDAVVKTSIRRVVKWGVISYILFRIVNTVRYDITKKPEENYEIIR